MAKSKSKYSKGVEVKDFKGNMVISLPTPNPKYSFSFGVSKAKTIISYLKDIEQFVDEFGDSAKQANGKKKRVQSEPNGEEDEDE